MGSAMTRSRCGLFWVATALAALTLSGLAQERDREKIPDKYQWNLADLYPSDAAWRADKEKLASELSQLDAFRGKLATSPRTVADALEKMFALDKNLSRLGAYAALLADQDTRDAQHQGMKQEMVQLAAAFGAQASFIEPEILRLEKGTVEKFIATEPRLQVYRFYLEDILRRATHTLGDAEEKLLADVLPLAGTPSNAYGIL